ncbi:MAG: hypothetical protein WAM14_01080 [Candidatus Nitrosopolaris sp.]
MCCSWAGPPGAGHVSFYTIPIGHDGWALSSSPGVPPGIGPYNSVLGEVIPTISGPDLTNIISNLVVVVTEINTGVTSPATPNQIPGVGFIFGPQCSTWDAFANGFHMYCGPGANGSPNPSTTELRIAVINP